MMDDLINLPTTRIELDAFLESVIEEAKLPVTDELRDAVATGLMHIPAPRAIPTRGYFVECARKAAAMKVAYELLMELKDKRDAAAKTAQAPPESAGDGQPIQNA